MQVLIAISGFCGFCSRVGNDDSKHSRHCFFSISTHVPTWGTTDTAHRGNQSNAEFQSTFPRGERRSLLRDPLDSMHFNPRSHVGNDDLSENTYKVPVIFQSTFPRGERPYARPPLSEIYLFQSTFPRGERPVQPCKSHPPDYFNPRSHVGNDGVIPKDLQFLIHFNPRSHVGNDRGSVG